MMEKDFDELINKVRLIVDSPKGELLRQLIDLFYQHIEEDYDDELLTEEDLRAIQRAKEDVKHGRTITLSEY